MSPSAKSDDALAGLNIKSVKDPVKLLLLVLAFGGAGTGISARFGLATKDDVQEIKVELSAIRETVQELSIEAGINKRLRGMQASNTTNEAGRIQ